MGLDVRMWAFPIRRQLCLWAKPGNAIAFYGNHRFCHQAIGLAGVLKTGHASIFEQ